MSTVKLVSPKDALLWLEYGGQYVNGAGKRVIDNLAERGDAPSTVLCGDGSTANTIPAQGNKRIVLDGTQYVDTGLVDVFERTDSFTLFVVSAQTSIAAAADMISSLDQNQSYRGIGLSSNADVRYVYLINTIATNAVNVYNSTGFTRATASTCLSYSGSSAKAGCAYYVNGSLGSLVTSTDNLSATLKNGKPFLIGARHNATNKTALMTGTVHFTAIFPFALSPLQVANLHKYVMRRINQP